MLFKHDLPGMGIPMGTVFAMSLFVAVLVILLVRLVVKAHLNQPLTGEESLVGMIGFATQAFEKKGKVFVNGEYWNAVTTEPVVKQQKIEVTKVENMLLHVKPKEE